MKPTNQQFAQAFIRDVISKNAGTTAKKPSQSATVSSSVPTPVPESNPAPPIPRPRSVKECRHIRANGLRCRGLAIKNTRYCYNHARAYQRKRVHQTCLSIMRSEYSGNPKSIPNSVKYDDRSVNLFDSLDLPILEDASSLQIVYNALIHATLTQQISERRAACVHRMLRSFLVLLPSYYGDQIHPDAIEDIAVQRDPEPLRIPFMKQFTMESVIAPTEEDFMENEVNESEVDETEVDETEVDETEVDEYEVCSTSLSRAESRDVPPVQPVAGSVKPKSKGDLTREEFFRLVSEAEDENETTVASEEADEDGVGCPRFATGLDANLGIANDVPLGIPFESGPALQESNNEQPKTAVVSEVEVAVDPQETNNEKPETVLNSAPASRREAVKIAGHAMPGSSHPTIPSSPGGTAELFESTTADVIQQPTATKTHDEDEELDEETIIKMIAELVGKDVSEIESYLDPRETNNEQPETVLSPQDDILDSPARECGVTMPINSESASADGIIIPSRKPPTISLPIDTNPSTAADSA